MKNLVNSKIVLICLSVAVILTACQKENLDETETVVTNEQLPEYDCPNLEANIGDACQDGWGIVTDDCDCVENQEEFDCPDLQANVGDSCQNGWGIVTADCDCVENSNEFDCPDFYSEVDGAPVVGLNSGDACEAFGPGGWGDFLYVGTVSDNCECLESNTIEFDCENLQANIGDPCQDGWGIVTADCDCVENSNEFDCPDFYSEVDGAPVVGLNSGDACEVFGPGGWGDFLYVGTVSDNCECLESNTNEFDCPNLQANIGDPCQGGWGIVTADCDCVEN